LNKSGSLDASLPAAIAPTLYARFGDVGFWFMLVACGAAGWIYRRKERTRSLTKAAT
jgi:apolipoprotein N-acyltransferase